MLSEDESKILSKQRIIQKNLVHFQGFPDRLYNKELLASEEYFGQYGLISKIILTNKVERKTNRRSNSAYITFYSYEQAAYAILSVDSIKIDDMLVRAFFGTKLQILMTLLPKIPSLDIVNTLNWRKKS